MFRLLPASYLFVLLITLSPLVTDVSYAEPTETATEQNKPDQNSNQNSQDEAGKININTASAVELQSLKGIGKKRAMQIVQDREANGPFASPDDLTRIKGIGPKTVAKNLELITVGKSKANSDQSDGSSDKK